MRTIDEINARKAEIAEELTQPEADLDALQEEVRSLNAEAEELRKSALAAEEQRQQIAEDKVPVTVIETHESEEKPMTELEIRSSAKYVEAFARYIRTENDTECRTMLKTENASGPLPVPVVVDEIVHHAWESEEILSRCRRANFRGNMKAIFERSADGAYVHTEGSTAPTEEDLSIGVVTMIPQNIKKWIRLPDEVVTMGGEAFVRYIYEELAYQVAKKLAALVVADIVALNTSNQATSVGAARITAAPSLTVIPEAFANLSDEAAEPVIIMNKLTYANFQAAYAAGNFAVDPFRGFKVIFNNSLPAYDTATGGTDDYAIVGDLGAVTINFPEGDGLIVKWDDKSQAEADLVKVVARQYVAYGVVKPFAFTRIKKPSAATT